MTALTVYRIGPPDRKEGKYIEVVEQPIELSRGFARIPGFGERLADVRCGMTEPFWNAPYALLNGKNLPDFAGADYHQDAVSDSLRRLLIEANVKGLRFHPVQVRDETMYLLGVENKVEILLDPPR